MRNLIRGAAATGLAIVLGFAGPAGAAEVPTEAGPVNVEFIGRHLRRNRLRRGRAAAGGRHGRKGGQRRRGDHVAHAFHLCAPDSPRIILILE